MKIVLDTGVFFHPEALGMMRWYAAPVVVPAVVFAERARQLAKAGVSASELRKLIEEFGATIEPLGADEAERYTLQLTDDRRWARLARDAFIAGHVGPEDRLFTRNPADFVELGVPEGQIIEVPVWRARERAKRKG